MNETKEIKKYLSGVKRRLNLPKKIRGRLLSDLQTTISARLEQGESWDSIRASLGTPAQVAEEYSEQMKEYVYRKSPWRFVFLTVAVLIGLRMVYQMVVYLVAMYVIQNAQASNAASIGIIGGADGPTAIFLTTNTEHWMSIAVIGLIFAVSVFLYLRLRKTKQK